jgi:hypothetical protein
MPKLPVEPTPAYVDELFDREAINIDARIRARYSEDLVLILQRISKYLFEIGLPLNEACELSGITPDKFALLHDKDVDVQRVIYLKQLAFKRDMLAIMAKKARAGDTGMAEKLLEQRYPEEFGKKRPISPSGPGDSLTAAIRWVRENGDSTPLVAPSSGQALIVGRGNLTKDVAKTIEQFLK